MKSSISTRNVKTSIGTQTDPADYNYPTTNPLKRKAENAFIVYQENRGFQTPVKLIGKPRLSYDDYFIHFNHQHSITEDPNSNIPLDLTITSAPIKSDASNRLDFRSPIDSAFLPPSSSSSSTIIESGTKRKFTMEKNAIKQTKKTKKSDTKFQTFERDGDIVLGPNGTFLEKSKLEAVNWSKKQMAVRGMMRLLFTREVLSTHSLTGKPSPGN